MTATVELREITKDSLAAVLDLAVGHEQVQYVARATGELGRQGGLSVSSEPFGPGLDHKERTEMTGFTFRLELKDATPADPPVLHTAIPTWLGTDRTLRVLEARFVNDDPVLVVERA